VTTHRTPLSSIACVAAETEYTFIKKCIELRFALYGTDPRCIECGRACRQSVHANHDTIWECEKHPGPLTIAYWSRRHRAKRTGLRQESPEIHRARRMKEGRGASEKQGDVPRLPAIPSNGKETAYE
jgi:hypothetical protein